MILVLIARIIALVVAGVLVLVFSRWPVSLAEAPNGTRMLVLVVTLPVIGVVAGLAGEHALVVVKRLVRWFRKDEEQDEGSSLVR